MKTRIYLLHPSLLLLHSRVSDFIFQNIFLFDPIDHHHFPIVVDQIF